MFNKCGWDDERQEFVAQGRNLSDNDLLNIVGMYYRQNEKPDRKPDQIFAVVPVGIVGAGKTTIMRRLASRLGLLIVCTDDIRILLMEEGYNVARTKEFAGHLHRACLQEGYALGVDADGAGSFLVKNLKEIEQMTGGRVVWLHVTAPEEVILKRLQADNLSRAYKGEEAVQQYYRRKKLHEHLPMPFTYTFDTSKNNFEKQLDEAEAAICAQLGVDKMEKA